MKISVVLSGEEEVKAIRAAVKSYKEAYGCSTYAHVEKVLEVLEGMEILLESPLYKGDCAYRLDSFQLAALLIVLEYSFCNSLLALPEKKYKKLKRNLLKKKASLNNAGKLV